LIWFRFDQTLSIRSQSDHRLIKKICTDTYTSDFFENRQLANMSFWNPFRRHEQPKETEELSEIKVIVKWNKDR